LEHNFFLILLTLIEGIKTCSDYDATINQRCTVTIIEKDGCNRVSIEFIKKSFYIEY